MKRLELRVDTDDTLDASKELRMSVYWAFARFYCIIVIEGIVSGEEHTA